jgi:hypothetical protein
MTTIVPKSFVKRLYAVLRLRVTPDQLTKIMECVEIIENTSYGQLTFETCKEMLAVHEREQGRDYRGFAGALARSEMTNHPNRNGGPGRACRSRRGRRSCNRTLTDQWNASECKPVTASRPEQT